MDIFKRVKTKLNDEIAVASPVGVRQGVDWSEVASGLSPNRLATVLRNARLGMADDYLTLAEEMEERDLHYRSVLSTRKQAVEGLVPTVSPVSDQPKDLELAEMVKKHLIQDDFPDLVKDALDALGKGYSVHEIVWDTSSVPWVPGQIIYRDPRWFQYDGISGKKLYLKGDDGSSLVELPRNRFIIHEPHLKSGLAIRGGLAMPMAFYFLIKHYNVSAWATFVDRYGLPIRVGKYGRNATEKDIQTLKRAIASIGEDVGAVVPESMMVEIIQAGMRGDITLYEKLARWIDGEISKLVLGQTMTADDGSSQSQAQVHNDVRQDILEADARQLEKTLNRDLVKPFVDLNWGVQEAYPRLRIPCPDTTDVAALVENIAALVPLGLTVKADELRAKLGLSRPEEGDEILAAPGESGSPPALNIALNQSQVVEEEETDLSQATEEMERAINTLVEDCETLEELSRRLPEILGLWESNSLIESLALETWKARMEGDADFEGK